MGIYQKTPHLATEKEQLGDDKKKMIYMYFISHHALMLYN